MINGQLREGWRLVKTTDILDGVVTGKKDVNQALTEGKVPFFSCARDTTLFSNEPILETDAILISGNGSYTGFVKKYSGGFDLYQRTYALYNFNECVDWKFVYYLFKYYFEKAYMGGTSGAAIPYITKPIITDFAFFIPDHPVQERIASFLSAFDDLIENNQRRIALLEEAARLLYREWFVHLRFPGHEHIKINDGVPEGWEQKTLFDCVDVLSGGTPKTTEPAFWGNEIPFFTPKDTGDGPYTHDTEKMITEEGLKRCNSKLYEKDTLFVTARGTVGKIRLAQRPMAMNQSCYALHSTTYLDQAFLYFGVTEQVTHMKSRAGGAVFDAIIVDTFKKVPFMLPSKEIAKDFSQIAGDALRQIDLLSSQNRQLIKARDLLLPRLMDGRLEI